MRFIALGLVMALEVSVAGCGGGGGSTLPQNAPAPRASGTSTAKVTVKMVIPKASGTSVLRRRPAFVSPSTNGVLVTTFAHSDSNHQTPLGTAVTDVSNGSSACISSAGSRTCTVLIIAPAGSDDFVFTLYDTAPMGGTIPSGAHVLGTAGVTQTVTAGATNVVNAGINAVIAGLSGQTALVQLAADGVTQDIGLTISPTDFGNNAITAGTSNAPFANPITVAITETGGTGHAALQVNGGASAAQVTVSKATDTVQVVYDGLGAAGYQAAIALTAAAVGGQGGATENAVIQPILFVSNPTVFYATAPAQLKTYPEGQHILAISEPTAANGTTYTVTPTGCSTILRVGTVIGTGTAATVLVEAGATLSSSGCSIAISDGTLTFNLLVSNALRTDSTLHTITEFATTATDPFGITTGADGNLWFAENNTGSPAVSSISSNGTGYTKHAMPATSPSWESPFGVTLGPDGNVWVGDDNSQNVGRVTTAGMISTFQAAHVFTNFVAAGLDGNVWFSECSTDGITEATTSGTVTLTNLSPTGGSNIQGIALGPDGNIWFTDIGTRHIGTIVAGAASEFTGSTFTNQPSTSEDITAGSDGNLWVAEGSRIAKVSTSGTLLSEFPTSGSAIGSANFITAGPDGAIWFTDTSHNAIGQITTTGTISEFPLPTSGATPNGITIGPDGNVWFTEGSTHKIGVLQL